MRRLNLVAYWTITSYGLVRYYRSIWQYVLPPLVTNALYFTIFGHVIGQHIGLVEGVPYINFIAPGLIMMTIIMSAFNGTLGSVFFSKFCRQIEEVLIAPIPVPILLAGLTSVGILRGLINGLLVCAIARCFVPLTFDHWFIAIISAILTASLFSLAAFTNAIFANKWDDIAIAPTFIITPITYLGGIFFSINSLPPFWQQVSLYNPILYIINAFRYGMIGKSDVTISHSLLIILCCVIALFLLNCYFLKKGYGLRT